MITVLILSLVFAAIEAGLTWLLLCFQPVANVFMGVPLWVETGIIFAVGMALTFLLIIWIGNLNISNDVGGYVRSHMGRTLVLALLSILAVLVVSIGGEMLYQADPLPMRSGGKADIVFVLDYSSSMDYTDPGATTTREVSMKQAFSDGLDIMSDAQRVSVIAMEFDSTLMVDWTDLNNISRGNIKREVNDRRATGGTNFDNAIRMVEQQVIKAMSAGRSVAAVMITDGEDSFSGINVLAPTVASNKVPIHTINVGEALYGGVLTQIASETGGTCMASASDLVSLSNTFQQAVQQASVDPRGGQIPDTLLTARYGDRKTIIHPMVLRILLLFLLGFWFKIIATICIGNNDRSMGTHVLKAVLVGLFAALFVEFGYKLGLPMLLVVSVFWVLMIGQIVKASNIKVEVDPEEADLGGDDDDDVHWDSFV